MYKFNRYMRGNLYYCKSCYEWQDGKTKKLRSDLPKCLSNKEKKNNFDEIKVHCQKFIGGTSKV